MHRLLVATRKGLFVVQGEGAQWQVVSHHFAGDPASQVLADPRDGAGYAALRMGHFGVKMRKSTDRGAHWVEVASPAFPAKPESGPLAGDPTPWTVDMVWSLVPADPQRPGSLWAGCMPAGLFHSDDGGQHWTLNRPLWEEPRRLEWMGGGNDHPGMHSVLVDPCTGAMRWVRHLLWWGLGHTRRRVDLGAAGPGHACRPPARGQRRRRKHAGSAPHGPIRAAQPDVLWVQHHCGIYRSVDGAAHWQALAAPQPSGFGFAVACDPVDPLRAWFVPAQADIQRYPVGGRMVVNATTDGGASFQTFSEGLPQRDAYHLVYRHALELAPDRETLAMASTTGGLWISPDAAQHWHCVSRDLPPVASAGCAEPAIYCGSIPTFLNVPRVTREFARNMRCACSVLLMAMSNT